MKIRLKKPAVYISKLTGGKIESARRGLCMKTSVRLIFCLQETLNGNLNSEIRLSGQFQTCLFFSQKYSARTKSTKTQNKQLSPS